MGSVRLDQVHRCMERVLKLETSQPVCRLRFATLGLNKSLIINCRWTWSFVTRPGNP
jgi:hypothetical protein